MQAEMRRYETTWEIIGQYGTAPYFRCSYLWITLASNYSLSHATFYKGSGISKTGTRRGYPKPQKMRNSLSLWAVNSIFVMLKQLFLFIALTFTFQLSGQSFPSTAVGGCTSAEVTSALPNYELDL